MAKTLPVMLLKDFVLLPNQEVKVELNHTLSFKTLELSEKYFNNEMILVSPKDSLEERPEVEDLPDVAVIGQVTKKITLPNNHIRVTIEGIKRVKIARYFNNKHERDVLECRFYVLHLPKIDETEELSLQRELKRLFRKFIRSNASFSNNSLSEIQNVHDLNELTDFIAGLLPTTKENKIFYMEELNALKRANKLIQDLVVELKIIKLDQQINESLQEEMEKSQKEYVLRERIKEIEKELGEENKKQDEVDAYLEKLSSLNLRHSTLKKIEAEIHKYECMNEMSPEIGFSRNYLELFFALPWNEESIEQEDLKEIEKSLNKTHYGLEKVKERILEYAAMKKRNPLLQAPIICLVGPPGVGKSTIASSIAKSLHRSFYKISVGGLNDSTELVGNRRSYIGSAPGKIIEALKKCGTKNPVLLIDEVDKMVKDYKGDPASTLLDILDPNLNQNFMDSYLEEPFDLSHVLFLLTANNKDNIPSELKDRLEIIELSSYTIFEKITLAKNYLIPRILNDYHVEEEEISLNENTLKALILNYTSEAGVRDLQRKLHDIYRKIILQSMKEEQNLHVSLEPKDLKKYLDTKDLKEQDKPSLHECGLVNMLAVTPFGGAVMQVEAISFSGKGEIYTTGSLGDTLKESLKVVTSYIKANSSLFGLSENSFNKKTIHLHFLSGAIPKNGPSAGVSITTSLISLLKKKKVAKDIAFTGEMTLRGEILPVGGIKEKIIGAYNYGIKKVYVPSKNKNDIKGIPKEVKNNLEIVLVNNYLEIYNEIFQK